MNGPAVAPEVGDRRQVLLRRAGVVAVVLLALAIRVWVTRDWNATHGDGPERLVGDEPGYDNLARELLDGLGFTWPGRTPGYPVWVAAVYAVFGRSYDRLAYVQIGLGLLVVVLTYVLGRRLGGVATGLLAALGCAGSYVLVHQGVHVLSEALYTPLVVGAAILLTRAWQTDDVRWWVAAGAAVGLANLVRPTLLLFPFATVLVLVVIAGRERRRQVLRTTLAFAAASVLVVLPWLVRNTVEYDAVFPLQTSNAFLWQGSPEYFHLVRDEGYSYLDVWQREIYGPGWEANDPTSVEGDRWWTRRAIDSILDEPLVYARYVVEKSATIWIGDPQADWDGSHPFDWRALRRQGFPRDEAVQVMAARFLPVVALAAIVVLRRRARDLVPLYLLLGYVTVFHALGHAEVRLSEPFQPLLLVLVALAVVDVAQRWAAKTASASGGTMNSIGGGGPHA